MVRERFFDHVSPGGSTLLSRVRSGTVYLRGARQLRPRREHRLGQRRLRHAARDRQGLDAVRRPPRDILDRRFRHIGVGVAIGAPEDAPGPAGRDLHHGLRQAHHGCRTGAPRRAGSHTVGRLITAAHSWSVGSAPMPPVEPLRALHYDPAVAGPLQELAAPPYDVIDPEQRAELQARSPYNVVAIDLPEDPDGGDRYAHAAKLLDAWRADGAVDARRRARDLGDRPGLHGPRRPPPHPQRLLRPRARRGLRPRRDPPARAHAPRPEGRPPQPHARDEGEPLADLLAVLRPRARRLEGARGRDRREQEPFGEVTDEPTAPATGCGASPTPTSSRRSPTATSQAELLIADGHHRYETARVYAEEIGGEGAHRYVLMCLVALQDEGLTVFPTHRLVDGLQGTDEARGCSRTTLRALLRHRGDRRRRPRPARRGQRHDRDGLHGQPLQARLPPDAQGPGDRRRSAARHARALPPPRHRRARGARPERPARPHARTTSHTSTASTTRAPSRRLASSSNRARSTPGSSCAASPSRRSRTSPQRA